jgi:hypothetical protein
MRREHKVDATLIFKRGCVSFLTFFKNFGELGSYGPAGGCGESALVCGLLSSRGIIRLKTIGG